MCGKHTLYSFLFWAILAFTGMPLANAALVKITDTQREYILGSHIEYMEDPGKKLGIKDLASLVSDSSFKHSETESPNFGYTESAYWVKFTLLNKSLFQHQYLLEFTNPSLDSIEIYWLEQGEWKLKTAGDGYLFSHRDVKNRHILFNLNLPHNHEVVFFARIVTTGRMQLPFTLWEPIAFDESNHDAQMVFGILYGLILIMILVNLYVFIEIWHYSYLFYVFSILSTLLMIATVNGHAYEYLWPGSVFLQNNVLPFTIAGLGFWTSLFGLKFLDLHKYTLRFERTVKVLVGLSFASFFSYVVMPIQWCIIFCIFVTILDFITLFICGILTWLKGLRSAKYLVFASGFYVAGVIVYGLKSYGAMPVNFITDYSLHFGAGMQVTLLSFALGSKFKELRAETARFHRKTMKLQKDANERLEQKVISRTKELNDKALEVELSYKNLRGLSNMGQAITATLDFEEIFNILYNYLKELMDASVFGVDIYDPETESLELRLNVENGEKLPALNVPINSPYNFSAWCFNNKKNLLMSDIDTEYRQYLPYLEIPSGMQPKSCIYIPLIVGDRTLGVVTVQSFSQSAYNDQHLEIMKTLATYAAIALDNSAAYTRMQNHNRNMTDSIRYAKRIQESILLEPEAIMKHFADSFVLYRPKDIVSGDFYWFAESCGKHVIALADCTGHGVPGAFMTMIGNDLLNNIVVENQTTSPGKILKLMDEKIKHTLHIEDKPKDIYQRVNDGMDISICTIDQREKTICFAGAKHPIYFFRNGNLQEFKGSKHPIGGNHVEGEKTFPEMEINYIKDDALYMFSDGYQDQFGGNQGKKYKTRRFRELLAALQPLPLGRQRDEIIAELERWKNKLKQTDDISVLGIKF